MSSRNRTEPPALPRPWHLYRTGSHLGIKDASGRFVIHKIVNMMTIHSYEQLLADLKHIVECVNNEETSNHQTTIRQADSADKDRNRSTASLKSNRGSGAGLSPEADNNEGQKAKEESEET